MLQSVIISNSNSISRQLIERADLISGGAPVPCQAPSVKSWREDAWGNVHASFQSVWYHMWPQKKGVQAGWNLLNAVKHLICALMLMVNAWTWTLVNSCHFRLVDEFDAGFASGPTFYIGHQLVNQHSTELLIIYKWGKVVQKIKHYIFIYHILF